MVQRDQVPEEVNDIEKYIQEKFTFQDALDDDGDIDVFIDDDGGSITIDTDGTELDLVVQDVVDALEQANNVSTNIDNQPISVDDNGSTITIDTDGTELDLVVQDIIDALEQASYVNPGVTPVRNGIDPHIRNNNYGFQPDGDLVPERATGQVFQYSGTLNAGETFTTDWFDTDGWSSLEIFVSSDAEAKIDGVRIEYTDDVQATNPEVEGVYERDYASNAVERGFRIYKTETNLDGFRFVYENNSNPASDFFAVGTLKTGLSLDGASYVKNNILGKNEIRVGNDATGTGLTIGDPSSLFGDVVSVNRRTVIDLTSSFGTSTLRDEIDATGSGSLSENPDPATGEVELSTGTTANSSITVSTAEYGRYVPGYSAQQGCGIRIPTLPTEGEMRWGYFDENDGFYWGYDGDQQELFVARRKGGTESQRIYRSNFNRNTIEDIIDRAWDPRQGDIFQIDFSWYGYGIILFTIVSQTESSLEQAEPRQQSIPVHAITVENETSVSDPNQPVRIEAENGDAGEDLRLRYGGRQFSVFGDEPSERRVTSESEFDTSIGTGWTHIMSWRRDLTEEQNARLNVKGIDFGVDVTCKLALVVNANLSGTTYTNPELVNPDETLVEVSVDGSFDGIGAGTKAWGGSIQVSGKGNAQAEISPDIDLQFGQNTEVALIAQGDGTGSAVTTMRLEEDW